MEAEKATRTETPEEAEAALRTEWKLVKRQAQVGLDDSKNVSRLPPLADLSSEM